MARGSRCAWRTLPGSGVQAALIAVAVRAWLDHVRNRFVAPAEVVEQLNRLLCECLPSEMFVTLAYLLCHQLKTGEARWVVAGHELPFIRRGGSGAIEEVRTTGRSWASTPRRPTRRSIVWRSRKATSPSSTPTACAEYGDLSGQLESYRASRAAPDRLVADLLASAAPGRRDLPDDVAMSR